jgi:hypothetical protein
MMLSHHRPQGLLLARHTTARQQQPRPVVAAAARPCRRAVAAPAPAPSAAALPSSPSLSPLRPAVSKPSSTSSSRISSRVNSSSKNSSSSTSPSDNENDNSNSSSLALSAGLLLLWAALLTYIFKFSPNQTPTLDNFVVLKLIGQKAEDPYVVNPVFEAVFNVMGVYPAIFGALLVPGGRSGRRSSGPLGAALPAWPFVTAAFGLGAYALIPYMALWVPPTPEEAPVLPPPPEETKGASRLFLRGAESPVLPALLLAAGAYWISRAVSSPPAAWLEYLRMFDSSRLVHATTVDFALCTALVPFWLSVDAEGRRWPGAKSGLATALSLVPVVGPCVYLLLRPKSGDEPNETD